jgi:hypothetical protein
MSPRDFTRICPECGEEIELDMLVCSCGGDVYLDEATVLFDQTFSYDEWEGMELI